MTYKLRDALGMSHKCSVIAKCTRSVERLFIDERVQIMGLSTRFGLSQSEEGLMRAARHTRLYNFWELSVLACAALAPTAVVAQGGPSGITLPVVFAPFDTNAAACSGPPGLMKALGFVQDNRRTFIEGVGYGLKQAAVDRGLQYTDLVADNDPAVQAREIQHLIDAKYGGIITAPIDPQGLAPTLQKQIWAGGYVGTVVPPPATTVLNAPQYLTGKTLGDVAASYIRDHLGGKADVVLLTQDSLQFLAPRFVAIRETLKTMPGVNIVADLSPTPVNGEGGYAAMKLVLEAHSGVDVVLGADTVVLGALKALREAGKDRPDQFLGGIDGEPEAIAELQKGESPYKASVALSSPVFGYALGINAADWLQGKSVPQAMDALPIALTSNNLMQYNADQAKPAAIYADPLKLSKYLKRYGNICYDSRDRYVNFPWSSEGN
jgi:ribose transport system substrate-binding protein